MPGCCWRPDEFTLASLAARCPKLSPQGGLSDCRRSRARRPSRRDAQARVRADDDAVDPVVSWLVQAGSSRNHRPSRSVARIGGHDLTRSLSRSSVTVGVFSDMSRGWMVILPGGGCREGGSSHRRPGGGVRRRPGPPVIDLDECWWVGNVCMGYIVWTRQLLVSLTRRPGGHAGWRVLALSSVEDAESLEENRPVAYPNRRSRVLEGFGRCCTRGDFSGKIVPVLGCEAYPGRCYTKRIDFPSAPTWSSARRPPVLHSRPGLPVLPDFGVGAHPLQESRRGVDRTQNRP